MVSSDVCPRKMDDLLNNLLDETECSGGDNDNNQPPPPPPPTKPKFAAKKPVDGEPVAKRPRVVNAPQKSGKPAEAPVVLTTAQLQQILAAVKPLGPPPSSSSSTTPTTTLTTTTAEDRRQPGRDNNPWGSTAVSNRGDNNRGDDFEKAMNRLASRGHDAVRALLDAVRAGRNLG
jgi:hypothetical protein